MPIEGSPKLSLSGRYSPLRYPGGKGKLALFIKDIIRENGLSDGRYVEPYAGGAAIAWELLLTGVVRRVSINDISRPVFAFWRSALTETDEFCKLVHDANLNADEWDRQKSIFRNPDHADDLTLGFAFFYLNRTNRSGILNAGMIGGREQGGQWKIDARFTKSELISRIQKIAAFKSRIELSCEDAVFFITRNAERFKNKTLVYIDPPYFEKGRYLYHDAYKAEDHADIASAVRNLEGLRWIVSYDDVRPIHDLYARSRWMQYTLNYSARHAIKGREVMFFSPGMIVPHPASTMTELARDLRKRPISVSRRHFDAG